MHLTKLVAGSVVVAMALSIAGPASANRGPERATEIHLDLSSTEVKKGDPVTGRVRLSWVSVLDSGDFKKCFPYLFGACFPGSGRLSYKIGEDNGDAIDWLKDGVIKKQGRFSIPFDADRVGASHPYVLKMRFRDFPGGLIFHGSTAKETFYVYP